MNHKPEETASDLGIQGEIEFRVRYQETDQMGVVYHANYFTWFEMGRTELLRSVYGISYRELEAESTIFAIVKVDCNYKKPARYDDILRLVTRVIRRTRVTITHEYQLFRNNELLAVGHTVLAALTREGQPCALPSLLREPPPS